MTINSTRDVRCAYALLHFLQEGVNGQIGKRSADHIVELKRSIRKFFNRPEPDRRVVFGDFDSYTELVVLPEAIKSKEAATEYFEEYEYMECPNSMYDCTGARFTSGYKVFSRNGRFMAYHHIAIDV